MDVYGDRIAVGIEREEPVHGGPKPVPRNRQDDPRHPIAVPHEVDACLFRASTDSRDVEIRWDGNAELWISRSAIRIEFLRIDPVDESAALEIDDARLDRGEDLVHVGFRHHEAGNLEDVSPNVEARVGDLSGLEHHGCGRDEGGAHG